MRNLVPVYQHLPNSVNSEPLRNPQNPKNTREYPNCMITCNESITESKEYEQVKESKESKQSKEVKESKESNEVEESKES